MTTKQEHEHNVNVDLGDLLTAAGLDAAAEPLGDTKRTDVRVVVDGAVLLLEAEEGTTTRGAVLDAVDKAHEVDAGNLDADVVLAVTYPPGVTRATLAKEQIRWQVAWVDGNLIGSHGQERTGTVDDLAEDLRHVRAFATEPDTQAKVLDAALSHAVRRLSPWVKQTLAQSVDLPTSVTPRGSTNPVDKTDDAAKRALLVLCAAAMFHVRLDGHFAGDPAGTKPATDARTGLPFTDGWPPVRADVSAGIQPPPEITSQTPHPVPNAVMDLADGWNAILAKDYRPVFEHARTVLGAVPMGTTGWGEAVTRLARAAIRVTSSTGWVGHDLLGRIFHKLLETAKYDGSYYTAVSSAALLAMLAVPDDTPLPENVGDYRVVDPACGTGTLLMAVAEQMRRVHQAAGKVLDDPRLIEDTLWGFDVNLTACHMTATTLGLLSPSTAFNRMNVALLPLDADGPGGAGRVGSLELLQRGTGQQEPIPRLEDWRAGQQVDSEQTLDVEPHTFDLTIMNPPFTRDSLRHDQFTPAEEQAIKAREKQLMEGRSGHGSSAGSMFMDLGCHLTKTTPGATFAFVHPLVLAASPSVQQVRELLAKEFWVQWVVCSHDPQMTSFSENTSISEVLVVCRRHEQQKPKKRPDTTFVRLRQHDRNIIHAINIASRLNSGNPAAELGAIGSVTTWPAKRMAKGQWAPLTLTSAHLADVATRLGRKAWGNLKTVPFGDVATVGPEGRRIRDAFARSHHPNTNADQALWENDTERVRCLATTPDTYVDVKPGKDKIAASYLAQAAHLLIAAKPRLNTARVLSVFCEPRAVGSGWVPVHPNHLSLTNEQHDAHVEQWSKALAVWLNSSLGLVATVGVAAPNVLSRPQLSLDAMRRIPVPARTVFTPARQAKLAAVFDQLRDQPMLTLADIGKDTVRRQMDDAVHTVLGVPKRALAKLRTELAAEPSVTG